MTTTTMERPEQTQQKAASQIVRDWPEEMTCFGAYRLPDGSMCSLGILADAKGYDWDAWFAPVDWDALADTGRRFATPPGTYVRQTWGFSQNEVEAIREAHDLYGKETAADLIESFEVRRAAR